MPVHLYLDTSGDDFQKDPANHLATVLRKTVEDVEATPELADWVQDMASKDMGGAVLLIETTPGKACGWMQWTAEDLDPGLLNWPQFIHPPAPADPSTLDELAEAQLDEVRETLRQLDGDWRAAHHTALQALHQLERTTEARRALEHDMLELAAMRAEDAAKLGRRAMGVRR